MVVNNFFNKFYLSKATKRIFLPATVLLSLTEGVDVRVCRDEDIPFLREQRPVLLLAVRFPEDDKSFVCSALFVDVGGLIVQDYHVPLEEFREFLIEEADVASPRLKSLLLRFHQGPQDVSPPIVFDCSRTPWNNDGPSLTVNFSEEQVLKWMNLRHY